MLAVAIGASAGGIEAFRAFFQQLGDRPGFPLVLALHLPANRETLLPEIIQSWTSLPVKKLESGTTLTKDAIFVVPPHSAVSLVGDVAAVRPINDDEGVIIRPIDSLFNAFAESFKERAVGVILSGTGSDGALGVKAIKENGGFTIAQGTDGTGPQYEGMPAAAIATGAIDLVLPVEDISTALARLVPPEAKPQTLNDGAEQEQVRLEICRIISRQIGHDFSGYRDKTFNRRVHRRMQVLEVESTGAYLERLESDRNEVFALFRDLLIRVTSFFRDPETFDVLAQVVMPRLFADARSDTEVRLWVPGCATGEEAYSLAIVLREYMDGLQVRPKVQIFATDIDEPAISIARLGRYPSTLLAGLPKDRLQRFFHGNDGSYVVAKEIREMCTFSTHSLVRDPPFSRINLVSCRNLLIYFDHELQKRVIPLFHYALARSGILLLGSSESTARHPELFEPLDKDSRIFMRLDVQGRRVELPMQHEKGLKSPLAESPASHLSLRPEESHSNESNRTGDVNQDAATPEPVPGAVAGWIQLIKLFGRNPQQLYRRLVRAETQLKTLTEDHQSALEELRSAIEELHSVNEEMQSTNEELETSKEELQSVNEELHTVNMRLSEKVEELDLANGDLRNLLESTEIATVFLDRHLIIRGFTPAIGALYSLVASDHGRPLTDFKSRLDYQGLREDVEEVLQTHQPFERRVVKDDASAHYIMRILPYRNLDRSVDGVLVTFVEITSIVEAEKTLKEADERKDVFLATLSHELRNPLAPIRTAAGILASPHLAPKELARVQAIISRQAVHMSSLLDDLLDISRVTRGVLNLKKEYVDLRALLENVVEVTQSLVAAKGQLLTFDTGPPNLIVEVDPIRITQVVSNLLSNAVKYTPPHGHISLACELGESQLCIIVKDDGIGMTPAGLAKVFEMFVQVDPRVETADGLGIGLALVKGLVAMHGGTVAATSDGVGRGSQFVVSLPKSVLATRNTGAFAKPALADQPVPSKRILIADDNQDGADALAIFLAMEGHELHAAHNGADALEMANSLRPDIAVLDIGMPGMTGYEVAERIRQEAWGKDMILIALTGWGQEDDKRRTIAAGFDFHATKPVDPAKLSTLFLARRGSS